MQLSKKKQLAARTLNIGKSRIIFNMQRLDEIKEAITKQDIKDLIASKAILIKAIRGSRKKTRRKTRRRQGSIKAKTNTKKKDYMRITRKLRRFLSELRDRKVIENSEYWRLRKEISARQFDSRAKLKDRINQMIKNRGEK